MGLSKRRRDPGSGGTKSARTLYFGLGAGLGLGIWCTLVIVAWEYFHSTRNPAARPGMPPPDQGQMPPESRPPAPMPAPPGLGQLLPGPGKAPPNPELMPPGVGPAPPHPEPMPPGPGPAPPRPPEPMPPDPGPDSPRQEGDITGTGQSPPYQPPPVPGTEANPPFHGKMPDSAVTPHRLSPADVPAELLNAPLEWISEKLDPGARSGYSLRLSRFPAGMRIEECSADAKGEPCRTLVAGEATAVTADTITLNPTGKEAGKGPSVLIWKISGERMSVKFDGFELLLRPGTQRSLLKVLKREAP